MREISAEELKRMIDRKDKFQLIDIREQYESEMVSLGGEVIPMGELFRQIQKIPKEIPVIIYCRSGHRSKAVIQKLERDYGYSNLYSLKGGIFDYIDIIDPSMPKY